VLRLSAVVVVVVTMVPPSASDRSVPKHHCPVTARQNLSVPSGGRPGRRSHSGWLLGFDDVSGGRQDLRIRPSRFAARRASWCVACVPGEPSGSWACVVDLQIHPAGNRAASARKVTAATGSGRRAPPGAPTGCGPVQGPRPWGTVGPGATQSRRVPRSHRRPRRAGSPSGAGSA